MKYIIGFMVLFIVFIVIGLYYRKKIYREVDRLEAWKIDIMNRPITDELAKVKDLNMTGQTEELFERWRNEWDELVTTELPSVEELLFDAEDYADKYRFKKAKLVVSHIDTILKAVEEKISGILEELKDLIGSEEKNRTDIEEQRQLYRSLKKSLLAHIHSYGIAERGLEKHLDVIDGKLNEFNETTNEGNYLQAREIVLFIKGNLQDIQEKMEKIPYLLTECETSIPSQLEDIIQGYNEMNTKEYLLDHIPIDREVSQIQTEIQEVLQLLEETNVLEVEAKLIDIKDKIETLYDLLENEVLAYQFVKSETGKVNEILLTISEESKQTNQDTLYVQQSYHLSEQHIEKYRQIEKQINHLINRFSIINSKITGKSAAYSLIKEELEDLLSQIQTVKKHHHDFREFLQALRSDELQARETITELRKVLFNTKRLIDKSNIPGVPESYSIVIQDAKESLETIKNKLAEKPLEMEMVNSLLKNTVDMVNNAYELTNDMIEQALLVEKLIQYGNRYRSHSHRLSAQLNEAENSFRQYDYAIALEQAATAIEQIDPNALKHIESLMNNEEDFE